MAAAIIVVCMVAFVMYVIWGLTSCTVHTNPRETYSNSAPFDHTPSLVASVLGLIEMMGLWLVFVLAAGLLLWPAT